MQLAKDGSTERHAHRELMRAFLENTFDQGLYPVYNTGSIQAKGGLQLKVYQALAGSIKRGVISPVYLLWGPEVYLRDKALAALKHYIAGGDLGQFNLSILDAAHRTPDEIIDAANTLPFFAEHRLVIVENPPYFRSKRKKEDSSEEQYQEYGDDRLLNYLQEPNPTTCLVFVTDESINKKLKTVRAIEKTGQILEFNNLKRKDLEEWIKAQFLKRGKKIELGALQYLLAVNPDDLGIINGEIEKLSLLDLSQEQLTLDQVKQAASSSAEASMFDLVDFIGEKHTAKAIEKLREILGQGEPPVKTLVMISRQLRLILAAKSLDNQGYGQGELISALGVHPYVCQKIFRQARNFSIEQLEQALETCLEVDLALKSGRGLPSMLLELAIISIGAGQRITLSA